MENHKSKDRGVKLLAVKIYFCTVIEEFTLPTPNVSHISKIRKLMTIQCTEYLTIRRSQAGPNKTQRVKNLRLRPNGPHDF